MVVVAEAGGGGGDSRIEADYDADKRYIQG